MGPKKSLSQGWTDVIIAALWKSAVLTLGFNLLRVYDPLYCNPHCGLKVMNTSDPVGYATHPHWKSLVYGECTDSQYKQWIQNQSSATEFALGMHVMNPIYLSISAVVLLYQSWQMIKARRFTFKLLPMLVFIGFWMANIILYNTHFEQDITYLTGGILHHAGHAGAVNKKAGTIAQGYLICTTLNRIFFTYALYKLLSQDKKILSRFNIFMVLAMLNLSVYFAYSMVAENHPVYHAMAVNGSTPEMDNSWPYTKPWMAYAHCITHHDSGYSFGGDFFLDPIYDKQLDVYAMGHNAVLNLQVGTFSSNVFAWAFDSVQAILGVVVIYAIIHFCALFMDDHEKLSPSKSEKAAAKKTQ